MILSTDNTAIGHWNAATTATTAEISREANVGIGTTGTLSAKLLTIGGAVSTSISSFGGNVGIGTTTRDKLLTVKCIIHTNEVLLGMNVPIQGPDYVFEKNYNLLSLSEIEKFITENKYLPEVPSAKDMEQNGLNLKEMNLLLLKKVEELTLHLIDVKKENAELQNGFKELTDEIKQLKKGLGKQ